MSQRRQEARRAKQERRRQERHAARTTQRRPAATATAARPAANGASVARPERARTTPSFWTGRTRQIAIGAGAVLLVVLVAFYIIRSVRAPLPGTEYASQGNQHLGDAAEAHESYNSNPPTSGWHLPPVPRPGIYTQPLIPEGLGHFMEHGGVWVVYKCPDGCPQEVEQLQQIVNSAIDRGRPTALAPFPTMDSPIAVVAWQYLLTMDTIDRGKIDDFINRHSCRYNPEGGPYCTGVRGSVSSRTADQPTMVPVEQAPFSVFTTPSPNPALPSPAATPTATPAPTAQPTPTAAPTPTAQP